MIGEDAIGLYIYTPLVVRIRAVDRKQDVLVFPLMRRNEEF